MSIEASYRRITPQQFAKLQSDPKAASSFFGTNLDDLDLDNPEALFANMQEQENSDGYLGIGDDWHALHLWNIVSRPFRGCSRIRFADSEIQGVFTHF